MLSVFGRKIQVFLVALVHPFWIAAAVFLLLFAVFSYMCVNRSKSGVSYGVLIVFALLLVSGMIAVVLKYLLPVEAVHFLLFSLFGWLSCAVFGPLYGAVSVVSLSLGDEILQHFLPDRVGDLHDVIINLASGFTGLLIRRR